MGKRLTPRDRIQAQLREFALSLPGAVEEFPWDEPVVKVRKKIFVFLGFSADDTRAGCGVKLPDSVEEALALGCERMGYGLGKSGWVTARFPADDAPIDLLLDWIEESYRAVAPKALVKQLDDYAGEHRASS